MFKIFVTFIITISLSSCVGIYASMVGVDNIQVFDTLPSKPYEIISICFGQDEYINDAIREIKIKARKLGADAIILIQNQSGNNQQYSGSNNQIVQINQNQSQNYVNGGVKIIVKATAIKFK